MGRIGCVKGMEGRLIRSRSSMDRFASRHAAIIHAVRGSVFIGVGGAFDRCDDAVVPRLRCSRGA
jgi:hypothetical protein